MKNNTSKDALNAILGSKTVSYKAEFAKILGSVPAAVMLSQAFFWQENAKFKTGLIRIGDDEYFSKTSGEWEEETGLSKDQQLTARKILVSAGMMKEVKYGMPAKMHYRMDIDATVDGIARYNKLGSVVDGKPAAQLTGNPRTSSGRFRRIVDGNPDNIKESMNSLERKGGEVKTPPPAAENLTRSEPEKKCPPIPPPPPTHSDTLPGAMPVVAAAEPNQGYPSSPINTPHRIGLKPLAVNGDEAEAVIIEWAKENIETIRFKYERAKRAFTNSDLEKLVVKFCGQYSSHPDTGVMQRFLTDPATFFNNKLSSWLVDQPKFERMAEPKGGASRDDARYVAPRASEKIPAYTP